MAEESTPTTQIHSADEIKDRGLFDFLGKKEEEKPQEEVISTEMEKVHITEEEAPIEVKKQEEKRPSLLEKLHRSDSSSSSSSSEEEVEENGEKIKRKKKKGLKEKIKEKISSEKQEEEKMPEVVVPEGEDTTTIPVEKYDHDVGVVSHEGEVAHPEEKKSFMEKIKEKLPGGGQKKTEETAAPVDTTPVAAAPTPIDSDAEPKKGILEKIKEKLPGYNKTEEDKKETTTTEH